MNSIHGLNWNFLFLPDEENSASLFYKCCISYAKNGKIVLIMTAAPDFLPLFFKESLTKDELKRLVIMNMDNINAYVHKLLELHDWSWLPGLIVVDLRSVYTKLQTEIEIIQRNLNPTEEITSNVCFYSQLTLIIASLLDLREAFARRSNDQGNFTKVFSVIILKENIVHLSRREIELLINLYYYKDNAFDNAEELQEKLAILD